MKYLKKWKYKVILLILIILFFYKFGISKYGLMSVQYGILTSKIKSSIRIVQLTDLHNAEFGNNNIKLLRMVADQSPDLILITGDIIISSEESTEIVANLLQQLKLIAPIYCSLGNHEVEYEENFGTDVISVYESCGAIVLDKEYLDIEINGQQLRLGGIYGYCLPEKYLETNEAVPEECAFLTDFQNTDLYTILLCHMPYSWLCLESLDEWEVDCVFCGHVHGGQIRLPIIGGLWAPDQGWFPGKEAGLYYSENKDKVMVLSRGLGSAENIPRFNNIPEIVVVDIVPKD